MIIWYFNFSRCLFNTKLSALCKCHPSRFSVNCQLAVGQPFLLEPSFTSVLRSFIFQVFAANDYLLWKFAKLMIFSFYLMKMMHFEGIEQSEWSFVKSKVLISNMKRMNAVFCGIICLHQNVYFANRKYVCIKLLFTA